MIQRTVFWPWGACSFGCSWLRVSHLVPGSIDLMQKERAHGFLRGPGMKLVSRLVPPFYTDNKNQLAFSAASKYLAVKSKGFL